MTATVHTRYASMSDLPALDGAAAELWLSPPERRAWPRMHSPQRRATWLAGRIVAKQLLIECLRDSGNKRTIPTDVHIESSNGKRGQRPTVYRSGQLLPWALSIAHTARGVLVAVSAEPGVSLGVDLVGPLERGVDSLSWCLNPEERRWLADRPDPARSCEQLWAMKESLYKACQHGEGFAPRAIECVPGREPRYPLLLAGRAAPRVQCWRVDGQFAALAILEPADESNHGAKREPSELCVTG
jgi:phosphopantetheinyl transferase